jgi:hypothetical protein
VLQLVSGSCEELTLPFLVVVCWNFGWFSFFPDFWQMMVPRSLVHPSGALAASATGAERESATMAATTNIVIRLMIIYRISFPSSLLSVTGLNYLESPHIRYFPIEAPPHSLSPAAKRKTGTLSLALRAAKGVVSCATGSARLS